LANAQLVRRPSADPITQTAAARRPVQRQPDDADQCLALALVAGDRKMVGGAVGDPPNCRADPLVRQFARIGIGQLRQGTRHLPIIDQAVKCLGIVGLQRTQRQPLGREGREVASLAGRVFAWLARGARCLALRLRPFGGGNRFDPVRLPVRQVGADRGGDARPGETRYRARGTRLRPSQTSICKHRIAIATLRIEWRFGASVSELRHVAQSRCFTSNFISLRSLRDSSQADIALELDKVRPCRRDPPPATAIGERQQRNRLGETP
jgi:hypothetical protein